MRRTSTLIVIATVALSLAAGSARAWQSSAIVPADGFVSLTPSAVRIGVTEPVKPRSGMYEVIGPASRPFLSTAEAAPPGVGVRATPPTFTVVPDDAHRSLRGWFRIAAADSAAVSVTHVWARPTPGAGATGAAYFTVTSNGTADRLVGVSTPIASADLHESVNDNGVMKMRAVPAIPLKPGAPVTFKPGGYHVMLTGLKSPLKPGDSFPLTLTFEHAQPVTVTVMVQAAGGSGMGSMPGMPGMH